MGWLDSRHDTNHALNKLQMFAFRKGASKKILGFLCLGEILTKHVDFQNNQP